MNKLVFTAKSWKEMINACEKEYPNEVCGLLFGNDKVEGIKVLTNILIKKDKNKEALDEIFGRGGVTLAKERLERGGAFEFVIDPNEHQKALLLFQITQGWDQIGLFHSHPDHPAQPSATDASQPMLAGWANVIVSVTKGKVKDADKDIRSWRRETENSPFQPQEIVVK